MTQQVPQTALSEGIAQAFRSQQTPPFAQMIAGLFAQSSGEQRAGILNRLLSALGPSLGAGVAGLPGELGSLLGSGSVNPQQAQSVPPAAVQQLAERAQQQQPSIVDEASRFYAQHPALVQTLGAGALTLIMSHLSTRR